MDAETFAKFLEKLGHRVIKTDSAYWYDVKPFAYLSFPFHHLIAPTKDELSELWHAPRIMVIRYPVAQEEPGYSSYRVICQDKGYHLQSLSGKARNQTRRGLENCEVNRVEFDFLAREGFDLFISTLVRQGRKIPKDLRSYWGTYCAIAAKTRGFDAWGAFADQRLVAYIIAFEMQGCYNIFIQRSLREALKLYSNNALVYTVTQSALARPEINEVSFGFESLQQELEGLVHFKVGMGFIKEPIKQRVVLRPFLKPILGLSAPFISKIATKFPEKEFWRKLNGVIKFAFPSHENIKDS